MSFTISLNRWPFVCRLVLATLVLGFLVGVGVHSPESAEATIVTQTPEELEPLQEWTDSAMAPTPSGPVQVTWGTCRTDVLAIGCATYSKQTGTGQITIDRGARGYVAHKVFLHELSHVFDLRQFYAPDRQAATRILGFAEGTPWRGGGGEISPSEWFAEAAARCYFGGNPQLTNYGFTFDYNSAEVQGICQLMGAAAEQPAREPMTFKVRIPPRRKMISASTFVAGTLRAVVRLAGRKVRSDNSCFDSVRSGQDRVVVGTCTRRVRVWSRSNRPATLVVRAMPGNVVPSRTFKLSISSRKRKVH